MRLDSVKDLNLLFNEFYSQPTSLEGLFKKAQIFNRFSVNLGLDYSLLDNVKVECSELFTDILMKDLLDFSSLQIDGAHYKVVYNFILSILKSRKSGVIWRFVSSLPQVRCEFLLVFDFRKCPIAKKYISELAFVYLQNSSRDVWHEWFKSRDHVDNALNIIS